MKKNILLLILICSSNIYAQKVVPDISARVDTTKKSICEIYHLYTSYLNSRPDSVYVNPYWNKAEYEYFSKANKLRIDRSANVMFYDRDAISFYKEYQPMVLQIDSISANRYQIKTIFLLNNPQKDYKPYSVPYITILYARRNENGEYKLENCIYERTKNWKRVRYGFITYIIHPDCDFKKRDAKKAVDFCKQISRQFNLEILPFKYYLLPNSDELGKLYNFEYWTYYIGAQANQPIREIFTTYGNLSYPHEFIHLLFPLKKSDFTPKIISEGLATWLGGPSLKEDFDIALKKVSIDLKQYNNFSIENIKNGSIRNKFNDNILYITGAVICRLAYEAKGKEAIWALYNSTDETLNLTLEKIFNRPYKDVEQMIINYLLMSTR